MDKKQSQSWRASLRAVVQETNPAKAAEKEKTRAAEAATVNPSETVVVLAGRVGYCRRGA
jgi:hypothetical protein